MGTCSYVLTGTQQGMTETFGSTCHGAGRALSRAKSRRNLDFQEVTELRDQFDSIIDFCCVLSSGAGQTLKQRNLSAGGLSEAGDGGGPRELQERD